MSVPCKSRYGSAALHAAGDGAAVLPRWFPPLFRIAAVVAYTGNPRRLLI